MGPIAHNSQSFLGTLHHLCVHCSWSRLDHREHRDLATSMSGCFHPQRQRILLYKTLLLSFPPEARWVMGQLSHQLSLFLCLELLLQKFKGFGGTGLKPGVLCMLGKSSTHITPAWPDLFMLGKCNSHFYFIEKKTVGSGQSYFHFSS